MRRVRKIAARCAAAALIALQPSWAFAQDAERDASANVAVMERSREGYDPLGLRFGGFVARPAIDVELGASDNLFLSETGEQDDLWTAVRVRAPIESDWSRHAVRANLSAERRMHQDFPSDDYTNYDAELGGRLDVGPRGQVNARVSGGRRTEPRFSPDSPSAARKPIRFDYRGVGLSGAQTFNRLTIGADVSWRELDYDDGETITFLPLEQDDRDRTETFAALRAEYAVAPSWEVLAEVRYNKRDFDLEVPAVFQDRDSDGYEVLIGAGFDVTRLVRGKVLLGYLRQDYEDVGLGWVDGVAADIEVEWFPSELTTVTVSGARSVEESAYFGAGAYTLERAGVRVDHELFRNIILTGAVSGGRRAFRGIDREDVVAAAELGATYFINRRFALRAGYRREYQNSYGMTGDDDYDANVLTTALTVAF
ncbi:MAG: outer membrane beta-barrel protein [Alphaproteobacteria bacterium]|nr:outer membrane beta-barrel protein [Alphaproteobacteria bacterium]